MRTLLLASLALGGLVGCADEYPTFVPEAVGPVDPLANECDAPRGRGQLGDRIRNFTLQNCYGGEVSLHDYCGRRRALWIIGSAGWCEACADYVPGAHQEFIANRHDGVELFIVLSEDTEYNAPTAEYCFHYAERNGVDPARVLIDPSFDTTWRMISPDGGRALPAGQGWPWPLPPDETLQLPWEAVLDPYDMSYQWTNWFDGQSALDASSALDAIIAMIEHSRAEQGF